MNRPEFWIGERATHKGDWWRRNGASLVLVVVALALAILSIILIFA